MAEQSLIGGAGGYAPLRVQRSFREFDDGRGARAAALAESLGVVLNTAPKVIKAEGDKAFKAGMEARIDGVKRENAQSTNKSMLGFMFSRRAQDGFDYQDAQLEIPVLQSESLLEMDKNLRESRNPNDFRAYIANQDASLQERFAGKSDIYRYTVADAMQKTRADQAKLFTSWVQSNREKDRRAAAAAAAKAQAQARQAALSSAGDEAFALAQEGGGDWFGNFVTSAQEKYGITASEAKQLGLEQAYAMADLNNDPAILKDIDPSKLDAEDRGKYANAIDTLTAEAATYAAELDRAKKAEADAESAALVKNATDLENNLAVEMAMGNLQPQAAIRALFEDPFYSNDPVERNKAITRLNDLSGSLEDPAMDTITFSGFQSDATRAVMTNDMAAFDQAWQGALSTTTDPEMRKKIAEFVVDAQKVVRDDLFEGLDPYYTNIRQTFPSGVGQNESLASSITGTGNSNYFEANVDTRVIGIFQDNVMQLSREWYNQNEGSMPFTVRRTIYEQAEEMAIADGSRIYGGTATGNSKDESLSRLKSAAN